MLFIFFVLDDVEEIIDTYRCSFAIKQLIAYGKIDSPPAGKQASLLGRPLVDPLSW
jgi:hypothetical protein